MGVHDFVTAAVLAPAVGAAAFTIARTKVAEPFRTKVMGPYARWERQTLAGRVTVDQPKYPSGKVAIPEPVDHRLAPARERVSRWFGTLVGCPYCLSHWMSWGAVAVYRPRLLHLWLPLDLFGSSWPIIAVAMLTAGLLAKAMKA